MGDQIGKVAFGLVIVAGVTTAVIHPGTAAVITAVGRAGANWTKAAIGH